VLANVKSVNSSAVIVQTDTVITASDSGPIKGKRVLVIEDGPTLTHGGMGTGAGMEAAKQFGAAEVIDPRPYAQGVIAATYETYSHLGPILPAVGYYEEQLRDLEGTINAVPADVVVSATPFSLGTLLTLDKPLVQITYELAERDEPRLSEQVNAFLQAKGLGK
jgi:predicted GTPase